MEIVVTLHWGTVLHVTGDEWIQLGRLWTWIIWNHYTQHPVNRITAQYSEHYYLHYFKTLYHRCVCCEVSGFMGALLDAKQTRQKQ